MFYNGIISFQEVFQIDSVRNRFPFSSAGMRWESSLRCEPCRALGARDLTSSWHTGRIHWAPRSPMHPAHAFCSSSRVTPGCAASRQAGMQSQERQGSTGEASACLKGEEKTLPQATPPFPWKPLFFWGIQPFPARFSRVPGWHPVPHAWWPFHPAGEGSTGIFKSPGKNLVGGGERVLQAPIQKWSL